MMNNKKALLSTIWIFVSLNYLYCDLMGLMDPELLKQYFTGNVDGLNINEQFLFYMALLMEIPIAMVFLSRTLRYRANRMVNMIAGSIKTGVMIASLFVGTPTTYYLFFAIIEIAATAGIVLIAWQWKASESKAIGLRSVS